MNVWDAHTRYVTVAHVSSESGDHSVKTFDGYPDVEEMARMVYEESPDWWMDPEYVYIEDYVQIRFVG